MSSQKNNSLENAPTYIKLAIDLIMLLEQHQVDPHIALAAIDVVKQDLEQKVQGSSTSKEP